MKYRTFHFCPQCGEYCKLEPTGRSFALVRDPRCPTCDKPVQMTGLGVMLIAIVVCLPISMILCAGATEVATTLFMGFCIIAVMRWIRQLRAERRRIRATNGIPKAPATNRAESSK